MPSLTNKSGQQLRAGKEEDKTGGAGQSDGDWERGGEQETNQIRTPEQWEWSEAGEPGEKEADHIWWSREKLELMVGEKWSLMSENWLQR